MISINRALCIQRPRLNLYFFFLLYVLCRALDCVKFHAEVVIRATLSCGVCVCTWVQWACCKVMREDRSRWQQHSRATAGPADGEREGAAEEETTVCSWSISPLLESSTETAGGGDGTTSSNVNLSSYVTVLRGGLSKWMRGDVPQTLHVCLCQWWHSDSMDHASVTSPVGYWSPVLIPLWGSRALQLLP